MEVEWNFSLQNFVIYLVIIEQPYIIATKIETKVWNDGSDYARIKNYDEKNSKYISSIIEEEGFEDDHVKVLHELVLYMNGDGTNIVVELHSRQIYE